MFSIFNFITLLDLRNILKEIIFFKSLNLKFF